MENDQRIVINNITCLEISRKIFSFGLYGLKAVSFL
jgi:hypothetical protein